MELRPRFALRDPQPSGPVIDGLDLREFRLLVPPDAPPGISVRWVWTAAGQGVGLPEDMALAADEMGDVADLEAALVAWLQRCLAAKKKLPEGARAERAEVKKAETPTPEMPMGMLR